MNWMANIRNRLASSPEQEKKRTEREIKKVEAIFGKTSSSKSSRSKGQSQVRNEHKSKPFSKNSYTLPKQLIHRGVEQNIPEPDAGEPLFDEGAAKSFRSFSGGSVSSDLMMLSKEAPIIVNRGTKRRRQGLLLQGGAPVKKKYEPAYQLNSTKATTASPTNIIDDLNLSPLDHGSHDIGDNAPSGLTH